MPDRVVVIRKSTDWRGRPTWTWRCTVCPRLPGRKPVGGDHRCSTLTSRARANYPPAFERCKRAALRHLEEKHLVSWRRWLAVLDRFERNSRDLFDTPG